MDPEVTPESHLLVLSKSVERIMRKLPTNVRDNIDDKLTALAADPMAPNNNVSALRGEPGFRLRVGDWPVLYELDHSKRCLRVLGVRPRGDAYKP